MTQNIICSDSETDDGYLTGSSSERSSTSSPCPTTVTGEAPISHPIDIWRVVAIHTVIEVVPVGSVQLVPVLIQPMTLTSNEEPSLDTDDVANVNKTPNDKRQLIKWSLPPPSKPTIPLPSWPPMIYGQDNYWSSAFAWFFRPLWVDHHHLWTLVPVLCPPVADEWNWHSTTYSAKVHFQCQFKHGWTSMKGQVVFWYRMRRQGESIIAEVLFKTFGQQCNRCQAQGQDDYLPSIWYPEEIENAVDYLCRAVTSTYYGGCEVPLPRRIRQGRPTNFHDPTRCQACQDGLCFY